MSYWIAEARKKELARMLASRHLSPEQRETLANMDRLYAHLGLSLSTRSTYAKRSITLAAFLGKPFGEAMRQDLEAFVDHCNSRYSASTINGYKRFLKSFYRLLLNPDGKGSPAVVSWIKIRRGGERLVQAQDLLAEEEIHRLAKATTHARDRALIMVLYESAARASELLAMRIADVDFDEYGARLTLNGKTGTRKVRIIQSVPDLQRWLESHPLSANHEAPLFIRWKPLGEPFLIQGLHALLRHSRKTAGLNQRVYPHLLRHSRLTRLAGQLSESELKIFAGWSKMSDMARTYIHLTGDDVDRKLVTMSGQAPRKEEPNLHVVRCLWCHHKNSPLSLFCAVCARKISDDEAASLAARIPALLEILRMPKVREALEEAAGLV